MFHIQKESKLYVGIPYTGALSKGQRAEAETLQAAIDMAKQFEKINPSGWNVFDTETGECVYGHVEVK